MPLRPSFKRPQWSPKKTAVGLVLLAETAGFAFARESTGDANVAVGKGIGHAATWFLDKPLENAVCMATSISPKVEFNSDCVQNFFKNSDNNASDSAAAPRPTIANQPVSPFPAAPEQTNTYDVDLVSLMQAAGYNCLANTVTVKTAEAGDGPISLLGDTVAANEANVVKNAFDGVIINKNDKARVAICK